MCKTRHQLLFVVLLTAISTIPCSAQDLPPVQPKKLLIEDGEFLKYGDFLGGERYQDVNIVSRYSADRKTMTVYVGKHFIGTNFPCPRTTPTIRGNS